VQQAVADYDEDEDTGHPKDGRLLAGVSVGLAVGGIVLPIVLSIAAIIAAGIAKRRLGRSADAKHHRSLANGAQGFAALDLFAQSFFMVLIVTTLL
jgi:hypothetical protein